MTDPIKNIVRTFSFLLLCVGAGVSIGGADEYRPVSVWSGAETLAGFPLEALIDGDPATFSCVLDDSRTGRSDKTLPGNGSTPVTMTIIFDLGQIRGVSGIRLMAHRFCAARTPQKVSVFACADPHGLKDIRVLMKSADLLPLANSNCGFITWPMTATRYLALKVEDSWEKNHSITPNTEPILSYYLKGSPFHKNPYPNGGWWSGNWGAFQDRKGPAPEYAIPGLDPLEDPNLLACARVKDTPLASRTSGRGDKYLICLAEVSFYDSKPLDIGGKNPSGTAVNPGRLIRDWMYQDCGLDVTRCFFSKKNANVEKAMIAKVFKDLKERNVSEKDLADLKDRLKKLENTPGSDPDWKLLYFDACKMRRTLRLRELADKAQNIVYVKHSVLGGWTAFHWTEFTTDGPNDLKALETRPGSQLCLLRINPDGSSVHEVLIDKPNGMIRNPNFSNDGRLLVFSMRDNFETDDFKLYVMDFQTRQYKQITHNPSDGKNKTVCADIEPTFTPDGNIVFCSTRCGHEDDCWIAGCSNLFTCKPDGSGIRRIGFDQVHTFYPQMLEDGRLIYTRWEYNDRTVFFVQSLFTMNSDGTSQTEFYGNQSWFPVSMLHARPVPGTDKVIAVLAGHHTMQKGQLVLVDRSKVTQGDGGIEFVAGALPDETTSIREGVRPENAKAESVQVNLSSAKDQKPVNGRLRTSVMPGQVYTPAFYSSLDQWGQTGPQYQFPYALDEKNYLCSYLPEGSSLYKGPFSPGFGLYYMTDTGERELLAFDATVSCAQSVVQNGVHVRAARAPQTDMTQSFGRFYVQNVYEGPGLTTLKPGTIEKLRVVGLEYRAFHVGGNRSRGLSGDTPMHTVVANRGGTWDVKHVLGEVEIEKDGSAYFEVPANTPVYFQLLDKKGRLVQTMRSWSTLMPGETFACLGCHEDKHQTGSVFQNSRMIAMSKSAQKLKPGAGMDPHPLLARLEKEGLTGSAENYWTINQPRSLDPDAPTDGFSYRRNIQPIWDQHCVQCHGGGNDQKKTENDSQKNTADKARKVSTFSLAGDTVNVDSPGTHPYSQMKKAFTRSYLNLTNESVQLSTSDEIIQFKKQKGRLPLTSWPHALGPAAPIAPYSCGSNQSALMDYLESSHYGVQVSEAQKRLVACWIDLGIPFCGSHAEANTWLPEEKERYQHEQDKRWIYIRSELKER